MSFKSLSILNKLHSLSYNVHRTAKYSLSKLKSATKALHYKSILEPLTNYLNHRNLLARFMRIISGCDEASCQKTMYTGTVYTGMLYINPFYIQRFTTQACEWGLLFSCVLVRNHIYLHVYTNKSMYIYLVGCDFQCSFVWSFNHLCVRS